MPFARLKRNVACLDLSPSPERPTATDGSRLSTAPGTRHGQRNPLDLDAAREERDERIAAAASEKEVSTGARCDHGQRNAQQILNRAEEVQQGSVAAEPTQGSKRRARARELVCEKLRAALGGDEDAVALAAEIEKCLHEALGEGKEYASQARAILFNLKASGEGSLQQKVLQRRCRPEDLPKMTADEMLSDIKSSERAKAQRKAAESSMVKADEQCETDMFTCEACEGTKTVYTQTTEMRPHGAEQKIHSVRHVTCLGCGHHWTTR